MIWSHFLSFYNKVVICKNIVSGRLAFPRAFNNDCKVRIKVYRNDDVWIYFVLFIHTYIHLYSSIYLYFQPLNHPFIQSFIQSTIIFNRLSINNIILRFISIECIGQYNYSLLHSVTFNLYICIYIYMHDVYANLYIRI